MRIATPLDLGTIVAIARLKALYRSGRLSREKTLLAIKAVRRGACRDRRGRFASCGGGGAVSQDVRPAGSAGGTREPRRGRPGAGPPGELKPKEVTPPGHLEARRQRVEARLATIGPERAAAKQELDRAKAENDKFRGSTSFTPERQAAKTAYGEANRRYRAIESEHEQLAAWEANVKKNPALVPPGPIKERLADYKEGDAHIARLQEKLAPVAARKQEYMKAVDEVSDLHTRAHAAGDEAYTLSSKGDKAGAKAKMKEAKTLEKELDVARVRRDAARNAYNSSGAAARQAVSETLAVEKPLKMDLESREFINHDGQRMQHLSDTNIGDVDRASAWLGGITREGEEGFPLTRNIGERDGQRAYHSGSGDHIAISTRELPDVVVHELGHAIDHSISLSGDPVGARSMEFLNHRVGAEVPVRLDSLPGVRPGRFDADEMGRKDKFDSVFDDDVASAHYVGKVYGGNSNEVLSMGVQALYNDPHKFITKDPEYAKFVIGVLQGDLR